MDTHALAVPRGLQEDFCAAGTDNPAYAKMSNFMGEVQIREHISRCCHETKVTNKSPCLLQLLSC